MTTVENSTADKVVSPDDTADFGGWTVSPTPPALPQKSAPKFDIGEIVLNDFSLTKYTVIGLRRELVPNEESPSGWEDKKCEWEYLLAKWVKTSYGNYAWHEWGWVQQSVIEKTHRLYPEALTG